MIKRSSAFVFFAVFVAICCYSVSATSPYRNKTTWAVVDKSLTDLLNDGWQLINQSSNRVAANPSSVPDSTGVGRITMNGFDEENFTFMLSKNRKYIICMISNPDVVKGTYSGCRSLN